MGLAYNANETLRIPNVKHEMLEEARRKIAGNEASSDHEGEKMNVTTATKSYVAEKLEAEAKAPRERLFKLPKGQAQFLTYLIKKYGEDYEVRFSANKITVFLKKMIIWMFCVQAMSRDKKNHYQLTWKQIRAKVKMFKGIPEQYYEFIENSSVQLEFLT